MGRWREGLTTYTNEQLDQIDRLVGEKVMGWHTEETKALAPSLCLVKSEPHWVDASGEPMQWEFRPGLVSTMPLSVWRPTRNRAQSMEVLECLAGKVNQVWLGQDIHYLFNPNEWICSWHTWKSMPAEYYLSGGKLIDWRTATISAVTPMLAICLAALREAGIENPA